MADARPHFHPIIFDFDGTVADTRPGIARALNETLAEEGLAPIAPDVIDPLTGQGSRALVTGALRLLTGDVDPAQLGRVLPRYDGRYTTMCAEGSFLYPHILDMLDRLPGPYALLTNKARAFTELILAKLELAGRFAVMVAGDDPGAERKPSPWGVRSALAQLNVDDGRPIFVADSGSDVKAGRAAGIDTCVVTWGYGGPAAAGQATYTVETVAELDALLWRGRVAAGA